MSLRSGCQLISWLKKSLHQLKLLWKTKTWSNFEGAVEYKIKACLVFYQLYPWTFSIMSSSSFNLPVDPGSSNKIEVQAYCLMSTALKPEITF